MNRLDQRMARGLAAFYWNRIPKSFRPISLLHWTAKNLLAASGPLVALYYGSIGWHTAYLAAAGLFAASVFVGLLSFLSEEDREKGKSQSEAIVRFGDLLSAHKSQSVAASRRDDAIRACLGIIEIHARSITKAAAGEIAVSLVTYLGTSSARMTIRHRNPGNTRPIGREFDAANLLGHRACQASAAPRVCNDLKKFRRSLQSPTQSSTDYKSMLFIPIEASGPNSHRAVLGFISVDCRQPYAFYGNRSSEIAVTCRPVVDYVKELIKVKS